MRLHLTYLLLPLMLMACSKTPPPSWDADSTAVAPSATYTSTQKEIDALPTTPWTGPDHYRALRRSVQEAHSLSETDRAALLRSLGQAYAEQLTATMRDILRSDCAPRHAILTAAHAEYEQVTPDFAGYVPAAHGAVQTAYSRHQAQLDFSVSSTCAVRSRHDTYDDSYDRRVRARAADIRAQHPSCSTIKTRTASATVEKALSRRHADFANKIRRYQQ